MHDAEPARLGALAVLALTLLLAGCGFDARQQSRGAAAGARRDAVQPQYRLAVLEVMEPPAARLTVELIRIDSLEAPGKAGAAKETAPAIRRWRFHPEFFLLPLAPVQTAGGLAAAGGLVVGFVSTYALRWTTGVTAVGLSAVAGSAACGAKPLTGGASTVLLLALSPPVKWAVGAVYLPVAYVTILPARLDGLFTPSRSSDKTVLETVMLPVNLDLIVLGFLYGRGPVSSEPASSRYVPYQKEASLWGYFRQIGAAWRSTLSNVWASSLDLQPAKNPVLAWAKTPWEWAWDSASHARLWGVHPDTDESVFDQCVRFAFDYSRYSPFPFLLESRPSATGISARRSKKIKGIRAEGHEAPCAISELGATVRANRRDSETVLLTASTRLPARGAVSLPVGPALEAFCYDDELTIELTAVPAADPAQRVSERRTMRVSRWRKPIGPHIRWLAPRNVVTGGTAVNRVSQKTLAVRILLRADTPSAPITMWQIKQDGKVRGGAFVAPGRADLGRSLIVSPQAKIEFGQPGDRTTLEVVVEASDARKVSSTATFVFVPSP